MWHHKSKCENWEDMTALPYFIPIEADPNRIRGEQMSRRKKKNTVRFPCKFAGCKHAADGRAVNQFRKARRANLHMEKEHGEEPNLREVLYNVSDSEDPASTEGRPEKASRKRKRPRMQGVLSDSESEDESDIEEVDLTSDSESDLDDTDIESEEEPAAAATATADKQQKAPVIVKPSATAEGSKEAEKEQEAGLYEWPGGWRQAEGFDDYFEVAWSECRIGRYCIGVREFNCGGGKMKEGVYVGKVISRNEKLGSFKATTYTTTFDPWRKRCLKNTWRQGSSIDEFDNWSVIAYFPSLENGLIPKKIIDDVKKRGVCWK